MLIACRVILFFFITFINSCESKPRPQNEEERLLYMMGQIHADKLAYLKLSEHELDILIKGLRDHALGNTTSNEVNYRDYGPNLERYADRRIAKGVEEEKREGKKVSDALIKQGGKSLSSGLSYKIIALGNEKRAQDHATVELHLHQTLRNKDVIYSTLDNGKKETFKVHDLLPGLRTALQLVGEGGEIQLVLPSDLAYGNQGLPPRILGGASISIYMKLFQILPQEDL